MRKKQLLENNSHFLFLLIGIKLSTHHDGEREVYWATGSDGFEYTLTVYNLDSGRYRYDEADDKRIPDFIEEVRLYSKLENKCFPMFHKCGIIKVGGVRLAWMITEYIRGRRIDRELLIRPRFSLQETVGIARQLAMALRELSELTEGGGHYNLRPENIILTYDEDDNLKGVHIIGLTNSGKPVYGNPPFKDDHISNLYRASETIRGIYTRTSDVYSIGMLMLVMLLGDRAYDRHGFGSILRNVNDASDEDKKNHKWYQPSKWNDTVWDCTDKNMSLQARIILRKVTAKGQEERIQTFSKLIAFLELLERKTAGFDINESLERKKDETISQIQETLREMTRKRSEKVMEPKIAETPKKPKRKRGLDDVAGMAELKAILRRNFVNILKNTELAKKYAITPPNGILLYGAPGCGKTFVAQKAAEESGLEYKVFKPSDFGSIYVHGAQGKIADAFKEAEKRAPFILIFDEFDAMAPRRGGEHNQENEVNEILTQMNNCASRGIYVMATTNRPDMIDSACLRAGRMDMKFYVGLPDAAARREIFQIELKKRLCEDNINLDILSNATADYTCADISEIVKETSRRCFEESIENGDEEVVPISTERLMEVVQISFPSIAPSDIYRYKKLKEKMELHDNENKPKRRVGFSTNN